MTAGTVVITGGILATVILLCIIAVLCYCRLQYYCCKKGGAEDADEEEEAEEEEHDLCAHPRGPTCNACSSQALDGRGSLEPLTIEPCSQPCGVAASRCATCSPPYSSPFYIRTADMVPNGGGGERLSFAPMYYKEGGPPSLKVAAPQSYPVTWPGSGREAFTNPRAISTDV
ncbi:protein FAM163A [Vicugna pacos]|uniref:Protein FAM163A n=1 Tax=Vicugna pacos TaxID=30538 RepID=A0ABM5C0E2_VICPA